MRKRQRQSRTLISRPNLSQPFHLKSVYLAGSPSEDVDYYLVKVIESRPVSNQIAEDLGIKHESPQNLYFKDKESVWNTSHWSVTAKHMSAVLD